MSAAVFMKGEKEKTGEKKGKWGRIQLLGNWGMEILWYTISFHKPQFTIHDFAISVSSGQHLNFLVLSYCYFILYENELEFLGATMLYKSRQAGLNLPGGKNKAVVGLCGFVHNVWDSCSGKEIKLYYGLYCYWVSWYICSAFFSFSYCFVTFYVGSVGEDTICAPAWVLWNDRLRIVFLFSRKSDQCFEITLAYCNSFPCAFCYSSFS